MTNEQLSAELVRFSCPQCDWSHELPTSRYLLLESSYFNHVHARHWPNAIVVKRLIDGSPSLPSSRSTSQMSARNDGLDAPDK